jgi:hypothetical protein
MVPFAGTGSPMGGSPASPLDPQKLVSAQWEMSTPVGAAVECTWNINLADIRFYK